ncbi:hypothetical protein [Xylophilus sp.]|uniref:hypothetical protein n=1 Tax=Xylophilus sp. TaxID=2653893 RepID=UPI0013BB4FEF|nr:hypothetical protein [Xylophilus sp.]KAF1047802.1 MAG: hypothetical protein GAK38_01745 [Xylophilus sp.]
MNVHVAIDVPASTVEIGVGDAKATLNAHQVSRLIEQSAFGGAHMQPVEAPVLEANHKYVAQLDPPAVVLQDDPAPPPVTLIFHVGSGWTAYRFTEAGRQALVAQWSAPGGIGPLQ